MGWYRCTSGTGSAWQPYTANDDIWGALDATVINISGNYSQYENSNKTSSMISFLCTPTSGYEGICLTFPSDYNLVSGTNYNLTFTLTIPDGITISTSYRWGCKWSATEVTNFNTAPTVSFTRTAGITENITLPALEHQLERLDPPAPEQ